jgi:2-dehydro-3-deoxygluconokinase
VTLGETMALLSPTEVGLLRHATTMRLGVAGAESNVAIGVRRLGVPAAWLGRVGDDELGRLVLGTLRSEQVDVDAAVLDAEAPTGLMLKERRTAGLARVVYYRRHSAGSRLGPDDLDVDRIERARVLHLTGITPALGPGPRAAVHAAVDLNYRAALWGAAEAGAELRDLTGRADLVFAGDDEAPLVVEQGSPPAMAAALAAMGPGHAVVKCGERGAAAVVDGSARTVPAVPVRAVDSVGAGDAFVAGYLATLLGGAAGEDCLATAAVCGAFAVTVPGDWEGLPTREELHLLGQGGGTVLR